jgi:tetratricopeptide (TPR) repeat protein
MDSKPTESLTYYDFLAWLDRNRKAVLVGTVAVVAVIAAAALLIWQSKRGEILANQAIFSLPSVVTMREQSSRPTPEAYLEVARKHGKRSAGERALLLGAVLLFEQGRFAEAQAKFEQFLSEHQNSPLQSQAAIGIAASLEAEGKTDQAVAKYREVITRYPNDNVAPQARLNLARIYADKEPAQALRLYDEMIRPEGSGTFDPWSNEASDRRRRLLEEHPELAATAAPAADPFSITPLPEELSPTPPVSATPENPAPPEAAPLLLPTPVTPQAPAAPEQTPPQPPE